MSGATLVGFRHRESVSRKAVVFQDTRQLTDRREDARLAHLHRFSVHLLEQQLQKSLGRLDFTAFSELSALFGLSSNMILFAG